ncbi:hypothetical protein GOP47_0029309 [Adiantum capillus-veneris]|nr:hypothetical protein GOP47_0029309 [Adiantum capillus-veneris]
MVCRGRSVCLHHKFSPGIKFLSLNYPVGSGISIAPLLEDLQTNKDGIVKDVYTALKKEQGAWLRLDDITIGNGPTHPIVQIQDHAPTTYHMGVIDENQTETVYAIARR